MTIIPPTCPDFTAHPHIVNGRGCYTCQCASASEIQGTSQIAHELRLLGIPADVHQTGGFTMCVYIKTGDNSYVYANEEGASHYLNDDDEEGENLLFFDDQDLPAVKAQKLQKVLDHKKIAFLSIS